MTLTDRELARLHWPATLLGAAGAILAVMFILESIPWTRTNFDSTTVTETSSAYFSVALSGPIVFLGLLVASERRRVKRAAAILVGTTVSNDSLRASLLPLTDRWPALLTVLEIIEFRLRGDPAATRNYLGPIISSPIMTRISPFWRRGHYAVVIPAAAYERLASNPAALHAVLLHELAHIRHRDLELLAIVKSALLITASWTVVLSSIGCLLSAGIDVGRGMPPGESLVAAMVGKTALWLVPALTLAWLMALPILRARREATADRVAELVVGPDALRQAEFLLSGVGARSAQIKRPSPSEVGVSGRLSLRIALVLGFAVCAIASTAASHFAVLGDSYFAVVGGTIIWQTLASSTYLGLIGFGALATLWSASTDGEGSMATKTLWWSAVAFVVGGCAAALLVRVLPLVFPSLLMPAGFEVTRPHHAGALTVASIASAVGTCGALTLIAIVSLGTPGNRATRTWATVTPMLIWILLSALESLIFPAAAGGAIAIIVTTVTCVLAVAANGWPSIRTSWAPAIVVLIAAALSWTGWADVNHRATCAARAADLAERDGDVAREAYWRQAAAARAPGHPQPWIALARFSMRRQEFAPAVLYAERALNAPYSSAWEDKFLAYAMSGSFRISAHPPFERDIAKLRLSAAIELYRRNSHLPRAVVAESLYNYATLLHEDPGSASAYLLEAFALDPELRTAICDDPDFAFMDLAHAPPPSAPAWKSIVIDGRHDATAPAILQRGGTANLVAGDYVAVTGRLANCHGL